MLPPPPASVHFMGIGGIGVSGLARILLQRGYRVSGCDQQSNALTDDLAAHGAAIWCGHNPSHLARTDLLVVSAAVAPENAEWVAAVAAGIPVVKRAELLGALLSGDRVIGVAGTHGKTTTSALASMMLLDAGLDPTAFVGGEVPGLGENGRLSNVRAGTGAWAVVEADEYDASFLRLTPRVAVITNVEADHLDFYGDLDGVKRSFAAYVALLPADGALVACADDAPTMELAAAAPCRVVTYSLDRDATWRASDVVFDGDGARFTLTTPTASLAASSRLSGLHNVLNALGAMAAAAEAGVAPHLSAASLARFMPPRRRQELRGTLPGGAVVVDDYAHHPTEIRATLAGLRARYPGYHLCVAFQPHTFARTRAFLAEIAASFGDADEICCTEIYAAREAPATDISARDVVCAARAAGTRAEVVPTVEGAGAWLAARDGPRVLLATMGAGDIWKAADALVPSRPAATRDAI